MKRTKYGWIVILVMIAGVAALTFIGSPNRLPADEQEAWDQVAMRLNQVHAKAKPHRPRHPSKP